MDPYDFCTALEEGKTLVNKKAHVDITENTFHMFGEFNMYVGSAIVTMRSDNIVLIGPTNSKLCMSLCTKNWELVE